MPATRIIGDFTLAHRRPARLMRLDVSTDRGFWDYTRDVFEPAIIRLGYDPATVDAPFDANGLPVIDNNRQFTAFISAGMWKCVCPHCGGHNLLRRDANHHFCFTCWHDGSVAWHPVAWPEGDKGDYEAVLLVRPNVELQRNFYPFEPYNDTLATLRQENLDHGLPVS